MSTKIREINGIKGFCFYHNGIPYTYIYTKQAIEMLGLSKMQDGIKKLRINRFGEHYAAIVEGILPEGIAQSDCGLNVSNLHYAISQDYSDLSPTGGTQKMTRRPYSNYDSIIPEYTLDRIIFAIANRLHNKTAEEFRLQLIWNIIPHFMQTATQDKISQVPILNQTSQFMYDNTNTKFVAQQAYNFNKNVIFQYVNRFAILIGQTNIDAVFEDLFTDFQFALKDTGIYIYDEIMKVVEARRAVNPYSPDHMINEDVMDTLICNLKMHNLFITFVANCIRVKERELLLKQNGQVIKQKWNKETGYYDDEIVYEDDGLKHPVEFVSLNERAGQNPLQEESIRDYIPNAKRDTSWIY